MCGIVGYSGSKEATGVILKGLAQLEYRGYDSAGIATLNKAGVIERQRATGKLASLVSAMASDPPTGRLGIGHTRWATHGAVTVENSHPHLDCDGTLAVVHNGIIENHGELRELLIERGHHFNSGTDTEVIPHLIEEQLQEGASLEDACRLAFKQLAGSQAVVVFHKDRPDVLVGTRIGHSGGIAVATQKGEVLLASDLSALIGFSDEVFFLRQGEVVVASPETIRIMDLDGNEVPYLPQKVDPHITVPTKDGYEHYTLKEINGQAETTHRAFRDRISFEPPQVTLEGFPFTDEVVRGWKRVVLIAMGTSFYAAEIGRFYLEKIAGIPTSVENASEFRYRDPFIDEETLVVSISQSGETADTLAGMTEARRKGASIITLCNVPWSQSTRAADYTLYLNADIERGVASTKCFTSSLICLYLLGIYIGTARKTIVDDYVIELINRLTEIPSMIQSVLSDADHHKKIAIKYADTRHLFCLGRGIGYPLAMEGALKLKEISYIHAEGYAAGEMKHGPIALIEQGTPVIAIALNGPLLEKMMSNISEMRARGAEVVSVISEGNDATGHEGETIIIPLASELLAPVVAAIPLQLLAYYLAVERGADVDMPKNLAKSVTVE